MTPRRLRILFVLEHVGHLRKFESAVRGLAERGHQVGLAMAYARPQFSSAVTERLVRDYPNVHVAATVPATSVPPRYRLVAQACRLALIELRQLARVPWAEGSPEPRDQGLSARFRPMIQASARHVPFVMRLVRASLAAIERTVPVSPELRAFLRAERPDVLLVTPLVTGTALVDCVRASAALGIPSGLPVASWDNLTTKGPLYAPPDALIVWNEAQREEAARELDYPESRVRVTGAHAFDDWFTRRARPRHEICRRAGLNATALYVMYACSSRRIAPNERGFVEAWIQALRASGDERLRDLGVIVRPHFQNADGWRTWRAHLRGVAVWPPAGEDPVTEAAKADYFDTLVHSVAVVGLNTTALIEAGIVGRPVLTIVPGTFGQETTPHFHHLVEGGLLQVARGFDEHLAQLARVLDAPARSDEGRDRFVRHFVRPFGVDRAGGPLLAEAVEALAAAGSHPLKGTRRPGPVMRLLWGGPSLALGLMLSAARFVTRWRRRRFKEV